MIGASKILTVSYGTFSCTLEGFDEPFNTMKAIAEYFRDLAADDRYFGAEPPTPDAAMLHRIAEREVQRRVEAKIQDNGVILRTGDAMLGAPAPTRPTVAEFTPMAESAAARLQRLRIAQAQLVVPNVTQLRSAPSALAARFVDDDADTLANVSRIAVVAKPIAPLAEVASESVQAIPPAAPVDPVVAAATVVDTIVTVDPVAEGLRETLAGLMDQDDQLATEIAPGPLATLAEYDDDTLGDATLYPVEITPDAEPLVANDETQDLADLMALDGAPVSSAFTDNAALVADAPVSSVFPEGDTVEASVAGDDLASIAETQPPSEVMTPKAEASVSVDATAPVSVEKIQRARARVIKIRRLDKVKPTPVEDNGDMAVTPALAEPDPTPALSPEAEADLQSELARLETELGASVDVPAIAPPDPTEPTAVTMAETPAEPVDAPPALVTTAEPVHAAIQPTADAQSEPHKLPDAPSDDAALNRILAQTNSEMAVPETKRRRSAIAHLKAAVLATVADRRINPNASKREQMVRMDPYRKDLDQVMRPVAISSAADRPAPLVLVSAQRIDRKPVAPGNDTLRAVPQSVRPRRVTSGSLAVKAVASPAEAEETSLSAAADPDNVFTEVSSQTFEEFAESVNATSMADLIEAAGAYCTVVLGRPQFTRPLLFQQITRLPDHSELSREDGLRGFGRLLRDGRIEKTTSGRYALTETSPILTEAKRIRG